jgi:hypothetical protein
MEQRIAGRQRSLIAVGNAVSAGDTDVGCGCRMSHIRIFETLTL